MSKINPDLAMPSENFSKPKTSSSVSARTSTSPDFLYIPPFDKPLWVPCRDEKSNESPCQEGIPGLTEEYTNSLFSKVSNKTIDASLLVRDGRYNSPFSINGRLPRIHEEAIVQEYRDPDGTKANHKLYLRAFLFLGQIFGSP